MTDRGSKNSSNTAPFPASTYTEMQARTNDTSARPLTTSAWSQSQKLGVIVATIGISAAYLLFVAYFAVNAPYEDDWSTVPLINSALHGGLSFAQLWALHDENRMLVPNLVFVASGVATHQDLRTLVTLSAFIFIATFVLLLILFRSYLGRSLTAISVLAVGLVWFSLDEWNNSLWAFQVAWYLILLFLMIMVILLVVRPNFALAFPIALLVAILASFSFIQGLALWPVGLLCIAWTLPVPRFWSRAQWTKVLIWSMAALGTLVASIWGYRFGALNGCNVGGKFSFNCPNSVQSYAVQHPWRVAEFVLIAIGEVVPNSNDATLWISGLLGTVLLVVAFVVILDCFRRRDEHPTCVPVALILFGLLFDLLIAISRVDFLHNATFASYTMPNLLILVGIVMWIWSRFSAERWRSRGLGMRTLIIIGMGVLLFQVATSSDAGIRGAQNFHDHLVTGARLVVNLDRIPSDEQSCYDLYGELVYLIFTPDESSVDYEFEMARADHLTVFSQPLYGMYRRAGLPHLSECR